mmetsp:Transcript_10552/g.16176  ORF Transcript_10552/g.16176 Transcript_10552/m.16176 type:complete len:379 (+) Transcript_10552:60-1196(+)
MYSPRLLWYTSLIGLVTPSTSLIQFLPSFFTPNPREAYFLSRMSSDASCVAQTAREKGLFRATPLIRSIPLSRLAKKDVYLKLDALQASGSFKDRGMAHLCSTLLDQGVKQLVSSSGGNAGLAVATIGKELQMEVSVIVPKTTKSLVVEKLKSLRADVTIHGENWNEADKLARQRAESDKSSAYISPYDNPLLWTGHSSVVDEVIEEMPEKEGSIGAVVVSVGGGGLICGVLEGLERRGLVHTTVIASETEGADSFGQAWKNGSLVTLPAITSIATSLGALQVTPVATERAQRHITQGGSVESAVCTDAEAVNACVKFAQDHRLLVEPACGAALAVAYTERLRERYLSEIDGPVVLEVCGGSGVNIDLMMQWKKDFLE